MKNKIQHIKQWMQKNKKIVFVLFILKFLVQISILGIVMLTTAKCSAQSTNSLLREGNKNYNKEKYNNATESYSKALQKAPHDVRAAFNQADALYKLNELDKSKEMFAAVAKASTNTDIQSKSFYNIGNIHYKQEKWEESVKAYKESLKRNPKDEDAKYNLMMAMDKIKKNQNNQNKDDKKDNKKDNKDNKDNKQQNQNKQQDKNQDKQQQNQQQGQNNQQQQPKQGQQQQPQMSKEEAQKLLQPIGAEESKVQQKLTKEKGQPAKGKIQKDW